jgi:hypothetical protein
VLTGGPLPAEQGRPPGGERRVPALPGQDLNWTFTGPRRCIGVWSGGARQPCLAAACRPRNGTDPQCSACAAADYGRLLARDAVPAGDNRTYQLYLAWLGPGLLKVGLTAAGRGRDRLLEQGAITFTLLAEGPYPGVRQAERLVSAAGLARERVGTRAKAGAWWSLPGPDERAALLRRARAEVTRQVTWPDTIRLLPAAVTDQAADFGLDGPFPGGYAEVTAIDGRARLAGEIRCPIGHHLLLSAAGGPLLIDMRMAAGRVFLPGRPAAGQPPGLQLTARTRPQDHGDIQQWLF